MNLFQAVKERLTTQQVAQEYGLEVKNIRMACCPFHPDKNPSMKLNDGYYYCFGCRAHGDVIDLASGLLGLKPYEAAKQLASDFGIPWDKNDRRPSPKLAPKPHPKEKERLCATYLTHVLLRLRDWEQFHAPKNPEDGMDWRFVIACRSRPYVEHLLDSLDENPTECAQWLMDEGIIARLQRTIEPYLREETSHE